MTERSSATTSASPAVVLDRLRQDLIEGVYYPRERLVEEELASRYEAKRAAVRSALMDLEREGLVEREPNRGARVRQITFDEAIEISEVRGALLALCAARAAERAGDEDKARLRARLEELRDAVKGSDTAALVDANLALSTTMRAMANNTMADRLIGQMLNQIPHRRFPLILEERRVPSFNEWEQIIEAICDNDVDAATSRMNEHVRHVVEELRQLRDSQDGAKPQ